MYFYKERSKQILDLRGDLVLTQNDGLVKARVKSAAPASVKNATYIQDIARMGFWRKVRATLHVVKFIWSKSQALTIGKE